MHSDTYLVGGIIEGYGLNHVDDSKGFPQYAANNFQVALLKGFEENNYNLNLVNLPFVGSFPKRHKKLSIRAYKWHGEYLNIIGLAFCNFTIVKHLSRFLSLLYFFFNELAFKKAKLVIYSVHLPFILSAVILKKINSRLKIVLIVLDMPDLMSGNNPNSIKNRMLNIFYTYLYNKHCDGFVLLTKHMPEKMKFATKPYIVIEGIATTETKGSRNHSLDLDFDFLFYAGGINSKYGIPELIQSFLKIKNKSIKLVLCGGGDYEESLRKICVLESNIVYLGIQNPETVKSIQKRAIALVNPRVNDSDYVKYSFPSKVIEYMQSGVPLIHHNLPGIPEEYYEYSVCFKGSTIQDMTDTFNDVISMPYDLKKKIGDDARAFINSEKNAKHQTGRIIEFLKNL